MKKATIALLVICTAVFAQQTDTFTDARDGKKYKSVKIGEHTWMAQNLDYQGKDGNLGVCYDNKPDNCTKYGRLYNWVTAMNIDEKFKKEIWKGNDKKHQGICPSGWHLPDTTEWRILVDSAGGAPVAAKKLKAKSGWEKASGDQIGTDDFGFSALPGGEGYFNGKFFKVGDRGNWWSSTNPNDKRVADQAYDRTMNYFSSGMSPVQSFKTDVFSIRCVQD
jgi:uncharacterized protein (TIGR02145 family)